MEFSFRKFGNFNTPSVIYFVNNEQKLSKLLKDLDKEKFITKAIESDPSFKGNFGQFLSIPVPKIAGIKMLIIAGLGKPESVTELTILNLGGKIADKANALKFSDLTLVIDKLDGIKLESANIANYLALGIKLKNYSFNKYFVAKKSDHQTHLKNVTFALDKPENAQKLFTPTSKVADGALLTRNLVSEPPNILYPASFAKRCEELKKVGVKVTVLDVKEMQKLKMGSILGVGQGSENEPKLVVMEWNGIGKSKSKPPLAFIGKGVTFDSGGINLKPSTNIADMKYDMGGAGVVTGLIHALAARKAKINVIGAIGLVENMPSGSAQRPSDVVTSMSGQTIEVDNTDAEGRLVLADVLWYIQKTYKPKFMVDLATLTGAIVIALGDGYAGLFSNCDELSQQLIDAGKKTGELLWKMPMSDHYDKQINSEIADVKNTGSGGGGSITAAQFLQRFVNQCTWAHIDIAAMTWNKKGTDIIPKGATGFGVRLLNQFVFDNYED